jgi:hypothetical protein
MTNLVLVAALLPGIFWEGGPQTAEALKKAGLRQVMVAAGSEAAWRGTGVDVTGIDQAKLDSMERVEAASVHFRMDLASATRIPWVELNGHHYLRHPDRSFYCEAPKGTGPLTAAEAFAYGVNLVLKPDPADLESLGRLLAFLGRLEPKRLPPLANIGMVDDGSEWTGELMKLMRRRNLMLVPVASPNPRLDLNVQVGSPEFPQDSAEDPYLFAAQVRARLTDAKRLVRIYGSDVLLAHLTGDGARARLHLLNFGTGRPARQELRIRLRGSWGEPKAAVFDAPHTKPADFRLSDGGTEFTLDQIPLYAVVDLERK